MAMAPRTVRKPATASGTRRSAGPARPPADAGTQEARLTDVVESSDLSLGAGNVDIGPEAYDRCHTHARVVLRLESGEACAREHRAVRDRLRVDERRDHHAADDPILERARGTLAGHPITDLDAERVKGLAPDGDLVAARRCSPSSTVGSISPRSGRKLTAPTARPSSLMLSVQMIAGGLDRRVVRPAGRVGPQNFLSVSCRESTCPCRSRGIATPRPWLSATGRGDPGSPRTPRRQRRPAPRPRHQRATNGPAPRSGLDRVEGHADPDRDRRSEADGRERSGHDRWPRCTGSTDQSGRRLARPRPR